MAVPKRRILNRPEQALQLQVAKYLDLALPNDAVWFHVPNAAKRGVVAGAMNKRLGVKAGVPDIAIIHTGAVYFIELKAPGGKASEAQDDMIHQLAEAGAHCAVLSSLDLVIGALKMWRLV